MELKSLIQSSHINFLIGSGASLPFLNTLGNVELLLSSLAKDTDIQQSKREIIESSILKEYFTRSIEGNIKIVDKSVDPKKLTVLRNYRELISSLNKILLHRKTTLLHKHVNLFTSNYDLFLEKACDSLQVEVNDGFVGRFNPRLDLSSYRRITSKSSSYFDIKSELPQFNIYKIHGSAGWKRNNGNINFDGKLNLLEEIQKKGLADELALNVSHNGDLKPLQTLKKEVEGINFDQTHSDYIKLFSNLQIINPNKEKFRHTTLNYLYYELLRIFSNELEKQNSVLFVIGFSFADEHIREIILRVLNSNPTLKVIVFAYDEESEQAIKNNLRKSSKGFIYNNLHFPVRKNSGSQTEEKFDLSVINKKFFANLAEEVSKNLKI